VITWRRARSSVAVRLFSLIVLLALALPLRAAPRSVSFRTDDGVTLAGTWYEPATRTAPAVILVHMYKGTRHDWDAFAAALAAQGIGALAFDLRGHGDSHADLAPDGDLPIELFLKDVSAARHYLATRPDVLPARIGIAGASMGATLAAMSAAQAPGVASLALLSASTDYRGARIEPSLRKYAGRTLFAYSDDDPYAARSARDLIKALGGAGAVRETLVLNGAGHGTTMLTRAPDLTRALIDWFKRSLL
jgi:dienelactone hydrolase